MKNKIRLMIKCICVIASLIAVCIFARINLLCFADNEAPYYAWNKDICNTRQEKRYDVLVLGDSASNGAYVPEILSDSTLSLALGGTTAVENYYILKEYLANNEAPNVIYISFSDTHMMREDCFYNRQLYTHRYRLDELTEIISRAKYYEEPSIITDTYLTDFISYEFYFPNKYITSMMNGGFNQRKNGNDNALKSIELHKGRYISLNNTVNESQKPVVFDSFKVAPLFDEYYRRIISLCSENNMKLRVIKTTMDENVEFTDKYEAEFWNYYSQLLSEYDNLTVDWLKETEGHFYFRDNVHMNNRGARLFSQKIKSMYPEDFEDEISDAQMEILDNDIQIESDFSELFNWIKGKEFTILFYDGTGVLQEIYDSELKADFGMDLIYSGCESIYYTSGTNLDRLGVRIDAVEKKYRITFDNGNDYEWQPDITKDLELCIINNRSGKQVCTKKFCKRWIACT